MSSEKAAEKAILVVLAATERIRCADHQHQRSKTEDVDQSQRRETAAKEGGKQIRDKVEARRSSDGGIPDVETAIAVALGLGNMKELVLCHK